MARCVAPLDEYTAIAREPPNSRGVVAMIDSMLHLRHAHQTRCGAQYEEWSRWSLMVSDDQQHCQRQLVIHLLGQRWIGPCHVQVVESRGKGVGGAKSARFKFCDSATRHLTLIYLCLIHCGLFAYCAPIRMFQFYPTCSEYEHRKPLQIRQLAS